MTDIVGYSYISIDLIRIKMIQLAGQLSLAISLQLGLNTSWFFCYTTVIVHVFILHRLLDRVKCVFDWLNIDVKLFIDLN